MAQRKSARSEVDRIAAPAAAAVFRESLPGTIDQVLEAEMERTIGAGTQGRIDDRMGSRRELLSRILRCHQAGVPITDYGLAIAYSLGILERALGPFPDALAALGGSAPAAGSATART